MKFLAPRLPVSRRGSGTVGIHPRRAAGWISIAGGLLGMGLGCLPAVAAESALVSWKKNPESDIAGYEVRYGTRSGSLTEVVRVGKNTRKAKINGLDSGTRYFFALVAVNTAGQRSLPSDEVGHKTAGKAPNRAPDGTILKPATSGTIYVGDTVTFTGKSSDPDANDKVSVRWNFGAGSGIAASTKLNPGTVRFNKAGTFVVSLVATDREGLADPTPSRRTIRVVPRTLSLIPRSGWALRYVDSEEADGYAAVHSFDGDPSTFWHTQFRTSNYKEPPHELQIRLDRVRNIGGFRYLPRQDTLNIGNITRYRFYVSKDGKKWGSPVASGTFDGTNGEKEVRFTPKKGRFIRLIALGDAGGSVHSNVAELNLLAAPAANRAPVAKGRKLSTKKNRNVRVKLKGKDPDGNPINYRIVRKPKHGKLKGTVPNLVYRPKKGFKGVDKFRYKVTDGKDSSKVVTVKIRVGKKTARKSKKSAVVSVSTGKALRQAKPETVSTRRIDGEKFKVLTVDKGDLQDGRRPVVQVSSDRIHWFSGNRHTTVLRDDRKVLRVRDNTPFTAEDKRFIRLKQITR